MKNKKFAVLSVAFCFLLIAGGVPASLAESAGGKPNIILILADDLGWSDLGSYGGEIETPTLDRLAEEGIRFTQFYNGSKCQETRSSLLSGQYWQDSGRAFRSGATMGHVMREAGYATFAAGKWHLGGNPVERGFDRYFGHLSGATDFFRGHPSYHLDSQPFDTSTIDEFYATDAQADFAIRFIDELREEGRDEPFFLYLAFSAPHSPMQAWPEDIERYRGKYRAGWDEVRRQRYERMVELGVFDDRWPLSPRPDTIPAWDELSEVEQDFEDMRMATYAAMVDRMDQAIGRVLARITELEEEGETLVMFLSDNGASPFDRYRRGTFYQEGERFPDPEARWQYGLGWANVSNTPFQHYKRNMFHGGQITPFIAHWPSGLEHTGEIIDEAAHIIDLMPTLADITGLGRPAEFDGEEVSPLPGISLRPLFKGGRFEREDPLFFHLYDHRAVIDGDWKLVSDWGRPWALFNLAEDRTELNNLAEEEPRLFLRLKNLWHVWWSERDPDFNLFRTTDTTIWIEPSYRHLDDETEDSQGRIR